METFEITQEDVLKERKKLLLAEMNKQITDYEQLLNVAESVYINAIFRQEEKIAETQKLAIVGLQSKINVYKKLGNIINQVF